MYNRTSNIKQGRYLVFYQRGPMIANDPNFKEDFQKVIKTLDGVLKDHAKVHSATFGLALTTFLTHHLMKTAPNDFVLNYVMQNLSDEITNTINKEIKGDISLVYKTLDKETFVDKYQSKQAKPQTKLVDSYIFDSFFIETIFCIATLYHQK